MAHNLLRAGHPLVVYDLNQSALDKLTQQAKALGVEGQRRRTHIYIRGRMALLHVSVETLLTRLCLSCPC
jgi:6-phosphogluconate dehydrogenase (decarboxylating)